MAPFALSQLLRSELLRLPLILLILEPLPFIQRDDVFPTEVVLDITDCSERGQETLASKRRRPFAVLLSFVVFSVLQDVVEVEFGQLLTLLVVVLVEPSDT